MRAESPGRRRRSAAELESLILEAAWAELEESSWTGFRMEAVARRAAVSKASLYDRWPSRGVLVRAALQHQTDLVALPSPARPGGLAGQLFEILCVVATYLAGPGGEAMRGIASDSLVGQIPIAEEQVAFIDAIIEQARATGELGPNAIPLIVRNSGIAVTVAQFLFLGGPPSHDQLEDVVETIWLPALRACSSADQL